MAECLSEDVSSKDRRHTHILVTHMELTQGHLPGPFQAWHWGTLEVLIHGFQEH